ncbi:SDR family oxidoreductase, partial [Nocardioides sp.]|uniref:SDR family oxidoreductase n=1 Tax=Nocardioides sp. TaxID=35761 RepID=UPI002732611B
NMTQVLVTGASGGLGRFVVPLLKDPEVEVRALSRRRRSDGGGVRWMVGDTVKGAGLAEAVRGVDTVVHLAGGAKGDDVAARRIADHAARSGARHLLMISVIGADRMPIGYFRAKAAAEQAVAESGVPWTVLRAAQFHTFVDRAVRAMVAPPIGIVPRDVRLEPVDTVEVAQRLVALAAAPPAGRVADLAGPEVLGTDDLVRAWLDAHGRTRRMWRPRLPGDAGRAYRQGHNLAGQRVQRGARRWQEFLAETVPSQRV